MITTIEWAWEDAFDKFGFGDGDGPNFTNEVQDALLSWGYETECYAWGCHNYIVQDLISPTGEDILADCIIGYDNPRDYLPQELVEKLDSKFN